MFTITIQGKTMQVDDFAIRRTSPDAPKVNIRVVGNVEEVTNEHGEIHVTGNVEKARNENGVIHVDNTVERFKAHDATVHISRNAQQLSTVSADTEIAGNVRTIHALHSTTTVDGTVKYAISDQGSVQATQHLVENPCRHYRRIQELEQRRTSPHSDFLLQKYAEEKIEEARTDCVEHCH